MNEKTDEAEAIETASASESYKMLGEFENQSGAGVLGKNTSSSGIPSGTENDLVLDPDGAGRVDVTGSNVENVGKVTASAASVGTLDNDGSAVSVGDDLDMGADGSIGLNTDDDGEFVIRMQDDGNEEIKLQQHNSSEGDSPRTRMNIDEVGDIKVTNTRLDVRADIKNQYAPNLENYPLAVRNTNGDSNGNLVLALKTGVTGDPGPGHNFVQFMSPDGGGRTDFNGTIQGDGSGGVTYETSGADYAEYLPRRDPAEDIDAGEVVGVVDGGVTHHTDDAALVLAVSDGDLVIPSGEHDGIGVAVAPGNCASTADASPETERSSWRRTATVATPSSAVVRSKRAPWSARTCSGVGSGVGLDELAAELQTEVVLARRLPEHVEDGSVRPTLAPACARAGNPATHIAPLRHIVTHQKVGHSNRHGLPE